MKKILVLCCFLPLFAYGQKSELSVTLGSTWTSEQNATTSFLFPCPATQPQCAVVSTTNTSNAAFTFAASYAVRVVPVRVADLFLEFPVVSAPGHDVPTVEVTSLLPSSPVTSAISSGLLFFTPSARLKFLPSARISPWGT